MTTTEGMDAQEIIASLQAEIAALRGELPERWRAAGVGTWTSAYAMVTQEITTSYVWDAFRSHMRVGSGTAPTLLEAIAACEAAREEMSHDND